MTAWTIQALKGYYDISLFTCYKVDISDFNKIYGTSLLIEDVEVIRPPLSFLFKVISGFGMLKYHFLVRYFKKNKTKFDVVFGTYKEVYFGIKGIQYIHFPELYKGDQDLDFLSKQYYNNSFLRLMYQNFCYFISGFDREKMKNNITLTNSNWTKDKIKEIMGIESRVVYPPVLDDIVKMPWGGKKNGFICIGRICPEKRTKVIIKIIGLVREAGFDAHIHIIGSIGERKYYNDIRRFQKNNPWIILEGSVDRKNLTSMISEYKYGINGRKDEHFGIVVAEMIKGGCIVFVPNNGGQVEIIDDEQLTFKDINDAVQKIISVLKDKDLQYRMQKKLSGRAALFSVDRFTREIREIIKELQ